MTIGLHVEGGFSRNIEDGISNDLELEHGCSVGGKADFVRGHRFEFRFEVLGHGIVAIGGQELHKLTDCLGIVDGEILDPAAIVCSGDLDEIGGLDQGDVVVGDADISCICESGRAKKCEAGKKREFHADDVTRGMISTARFRFTGHFGCKATMRGVDRGMKQIALVCALLLLPVVMHFQNVDAAPAPDSPAGVTSSLLHTALKHIGFTSDTLKTEKQYITPDLYSRLMKKANQPVAKGDAPDIEGDVFLNCQDDPTGIEIGKATIDHDKATVEVVISFDQEKQHNKVLLQQVNGAWKVYDIVYDKDGKLTDLLK
jgi:hypothetical protein